MPEVHGALLHVDEKGLINAVPAKGLKMQPRSCGVRGFSGFRDSPCDSEVLCSSGCKSPVALNGACSPGDDYIHMRVEHEKPPTLSCTGKLLISERRDAVLAREFLWFYFNGTLGLQGIHTCK